MVNIGIIGCGGMGEHHARIINKAEGATLAGVADEIEEKANGFAEEMQTQAYTDFHDMLPRVDGVMVCTPPFARTDIVADCAVSGKHIFAEKPIGLNMNDAYKMVDAAQRAGVIMMMGYVLRFTHPFQVMHETYASGKLGRLVNCWTRRYMPYDTSTRWYGDQSKSGGVALDFASHDIDWVRWIGGDVRRVFGRVDRVRPGIQADEHVHALFSFDEGMGAIDDSWAPGLSDSSIGIVGSEGSIIVERDGTIRQKLNDREETIVTPEPGETIQEHFIARVKDGKPPKITGQDALEVLRIVLAIQESSRTGQAVNL